MPPKTNPTFQKIEAKYEAYYRHQFEVKLGMAMQIVQDAACFAANKRFKMGPGRADGFCDDIREFTNEIAWLMNTDLKDDPNYEYTKTKVDERLKRIVGKKKFLPWEIRYPK